MRYRSEALLFALACIAILAGYSWIAAPARPQFGLVEPSQQHFNQLVAGFRSGQLSLKQVPAPEITAEVMAPAARLVVKPATTCR